MSEHTDNTSGGGAALQCLKYGNITAHLGYICAVIKPRLGSDKTGFYSVQSEETDIVILKLNEECGWFPFNCGLWQRVVLKIIYFRHCCSAI